MTLQERIVTLSEYSLSFETIEGNFVVAIAFNPKWKIKQPENEKIKLYTDSNRQGICYYEIPVGEDIEEIFKCIDEVIKFNKEHEEKVVLFKEKVDELKKIFTTESLTTLKTLEFKLKKRKEKQKTDKDTTKLSEGPKIEEKEAKKECETDNEKPINEIDEPEDINVGIDKNIENKIEAAIKKKNK